MYRHFTSESVSEGHPDKMADQISDAVLDAIIAQDPKARVGCEVLVKTGLVVVAGEIKTSCYIDVEKIARKVIEDIGYTDPDYGMDYRSCGVLNAIGEQSPDISKGVDKEEGETGAGDQGMMFGYATDETDVFMPVAITYAHRLMKKHAELRKSGAIKELRPDAKAQLSFEFDDEGNPLRIDAIVLSSQHDPGIKIKEFKEAITEQIIRELITKEHPNWIDDRTKIWINPAGDFVTGGPQGDCGLTGRKIIVDTYGGAAPHGGGAFSGKDPSKVDRSGAYAARYIAKNIVAAGLAKKCEIQLSYAIGVEEPTSVSVRTFDTSKDSLDDNKLSEIIGKSGVFNLTPQGITKMLDLERPIYTPTATYGHFGRNEDNFSWERTDKVDALKQAC